MTQFSIGDAARKTFVLLGVLSSISLCAQSSSARTGSPLAGTPWNAASFSPGDYTCVQTNVGTVYNKCAPSATQFDWHMPVNYDTAGVKTAAVYYSGLGPSCRMYHTTTTGAIFAGPAGTFGGGAVTVTSNGSVPINAAIDIGCTVYSSGQGQTQLNGYTWNQ
jgi:hypothetical protein